MTDKYDEAIAYLLEDDGLAFETKVHGAWSEPYDAPGGCLFAHAGRPGTVVRYENGEYVYCGCLTQVRAGRTMTGHLAEAATLALTRLIQDDERLPKSDTDIRPEHLPVFAEWQRRIDKMGIR